MSARRRRAQGSRSTRSSAAPRTFAGVLSPGIASLHTCEIGEVNKEFSTQIFCSGMQNIPRTQVSGHGRL